MDITTISDLHGHFPKNLPGGDLLIVAGDLNARDTEKDWCDFETWICKQNYKEKIIIAGNHDNFLQTMDEHCMWRYWGKVGITYLCDSGTAFCGTDFEGNSYTMKIWGSPWSLTFPGMNPLCKAFTVDTEEELAEKWALIPDDIDILITHSPPYGVLDQVPTDSKINKGSKSLRNSIEKIMPEMVLFGHIHEQGGKYVQKEGILYINGSLVDERYRNVNRARRIIFDEEMPKMQRFKVIE